MDEQTRNERLERLFFELFEPLPRQGPGNLACARRALAACDGLPPHPKILDLGCGAGGQTLQLAQLSAGTILAVDRHPPLIARLVEAVRERSLTDRIVARVADMEALDLEPGSFDLVWSEGALYNLGLERALPLCADLLPSGGYLAFTDAIWRTERAPARVREAFADYPTMGTIADILALLERGPWTVLDHFVLPDEAWWDDFYGPMERRIEALRVQYADDLDALAVLDDLAKEPPMHREYGHTYGYGFFVARRR